jgi:hypothetical protein
MLSPTSLAAVSTPAIGASGLSGQVQRIRSVTPQPAQSGLQAVQSGSAPATRDVPDRVLPRGSLLDLSV